MAREQKYEIKDYWELKKHFFFFVKKFENILGTKPKKALKLKTYFQILELKEMDKMLI
jgi:hypothetical protein